LIANSSRVERNGRSRVGAAASTVLLPSVYSRWSAAVLSLIEIMRSANAARVSGVSRPSTLARRDPMASVLALALNPMSQGGAFSNFARQNNPQKASE
jgi:hypothetical protein